VSERRYEHAGRETRVEVQLDAGGTARVRVGERSLAARVVHTDGPALVAEIDGRRVRVVTVREQGTRLVFHRGRVYRLGTPAPSGGRPAAGAGDDGALCASMPATLVRLEVAVGDRVEAGQMVAVVEAMKMTHDLRARHAGRVREVRFEVGQQVEPGVAIAVIAPDAEGAEAEGAS